MYKNEGNDAYKRRDFSNAVHFYTKGIKVNCKDDELNAKLYSNRAIAHFNSGKIFLSLFIRNILTFCYGKVNNLFRGGNNITL